MFASLDVIADGLRDIGPFKMADYPEIAAHPVVGKFRRPWLITDAGDVQEWGTDFRHFQSERQVSDVNLLDNLKFVRHQAVEEFLKWMEGGFHDTFGKDADPSQYGVCVLRDWLFREYVWKNSVTGLVMVETCCSVRIFKALTTDDLKGTACSDTASTT